MSRESISTRYDNQGVSRVSPYTQALLCCCHCDGTALLGPADAVLLEQALADSHRLSPNQVQRALDESGRAYEIGQDQVLHERCGCYLGHGRMMYTEDLDTLRRVAVPSPELLNEMSTHYVMTPIDLDQLLELLGVYDPAVRQTLLSPDVTVAEDDEDPDATTRAVLAQRQAVLGQYGVYVVDGQFTRLRPKDLDAVHERIYITEADRQAFKAKNRANQAIPQPRDPAIIWQLSYPVRWQEGVDSRFCQLCLQPVCADAPGLGWRKPGHESPLYWHIDCYKFLYNRQLNREEDAMKEDFTQLQLARLHDVSVRLGRLPKKEYLAYKQANEATDAFYAETFLRRVEQQLGIQLV